MPRKRSSKKKAAPPLRTPETYTTTDDLNSENAEPEAERSADALHDTAAPDEPALDLGPSEVTSAGHLDPPGISGDLLADLPDDEPDGSKRFAKRYARSVRTLVHVRESAEDSWKEVIEVHTVSRNGAALELSRPCPVGRIVTLVMEMPPELRAYDHYAPVYPVAGVVQNCMEIDVDGSPAYHVGVAFIGKQLPHAHKDDPTRTYRIYGVDSSGLLRVKEISHDYTPRRDLRLWHSIPVTVSYRNEKEKTVERSVVRTRDISSGGMAVWGPLEVEIGDRLKLSSKEHSFFSTARVCNRSDHPVDDGKSVIHIQFEENRFPVQMLTERDGDGGEPWPPPEEEPTTRT